MVYSPAADLDAATVDSFSYTVSNGVGSATATAYLEVPTATDRISATMLSVDANPSGPGKAVVFAAVPGLVYEIRASSDLSGWTSLGLHAADSLGRVAVLDTSATGASRFYTLSHQRIP